MKKCLFITLLLLFSLNFGYSQEVTGIIKYRFMYSKATPQEGKVVGEFIADYDIPAYLYFNSQKSLFNYDKAEYNKELKYKRKEDNYGQMYYIDKSKNALYIREFIYRAVYMTSETIPIIPWQLKNEVKTISGYVCKKAEAEFRG
ncbi:MAG: GLPGLI family protein, partial [Bacteroidia bacterium]|nr:GLPGLI family protein [Bacteroidia bacterium]